MSQMRTVKPLDLPIDSYGPAVGSLTDANGSILFDLWGDCGAHPLGYDLRTSISRFLASGIPHRLPQMFQNDYRDLVARRLCAYVGMDQVFFCNSGAEANEAAIKLARLYWHKRGMKNKRNIVTFHGQFFGRTGFSLAATGVPDDHYYKDGFGPMPEGFISVETDFSDAKPEWSDVAAIILSPLFVNNAVGKYNPQLWRDIEAIRKEYKCLLILDEVQTGAGRTGTYCAFHRDTLGIPEPDIVTLGKGLAAGLPAGACLADEELAVFTPGTHFSTFGGAPLILWMIDEVIRAHANRQTQIIDKIEPSIISFFESQKWIESFDGAGLHWGFLPVWRGFDGFQFCEAARKAGLIMCTHRQYGQLRIFPPLIADWLMILDWLHRLPDIYKACSVEGEASL